MRSLPKATWPVVVAALSAMGSPTSSWGASAVQSDMYGRRYCEYLFVKGTPPDLTADVWNTYGLNDCPAKLWKASDAATLAKAEGALLVRLNGPRHWLVDRVRVDLGPGLGEVKTFTGGLRMRKVATVKVPLVNGAPGNAPYAEVTVNRRNTFTWPKAHPVHELVSPRGRVYVMQAYSGIVDPDLKRSDLGTLGRRLKLPAGWRYRTRTLTKDLSLTTTGKATVVQDELQNTYQRER